MNNSDQVTFKCRHWQQRRSISSSKRNETFEKNRSLVGDRSEEYVYWWSCTFSQWQIQRAWLSPVWDAGSVWGILQDLWAWRSIYRFEEGSEVQRRIFKVGVSTLCSFFVISWHFDCALKLVILKMMIEKTNLTWNHGCTRSFRSITAWPSLEVYQAPRLTCTMKAQRSRFGGTKELSSWIWFDIINKCSILYSCQGKIARS